ncbi:MAG: competence/damage-inducible protein A [Pseudomonadota bacterium]
MFDVKNHTDGQVTAGMLIIGDEILSGRIRDSNAHHLAKMLTLVGIDLKEIRAVADEQDAIVFAVNELRAKFTYVFTSGGIGPTHDDITADAIGAAFGLPVDFHTDAMALLETYYKERDVDFTAARKRMARTPENADLIDNPISKAPGFVVGNVHVMAGVPAVFEAMLDNVIPTLKTGEKIVSGSVHCPFGEGVIGARLAALQGEHDRTMIGSYPRYEDGAFWTEIVVRSRNPEAQLEAISAVEQLVSSLKQH